MNKKYMGSAKIFSRISYLSLSILYLCTFLFLLFAPTSRVQAFPVNQINAKTATFADKTASVINVKIGSTTLTFKRNPTPPQKSGTTFDFSGILYQYDLVTGTVDDGCKSGKLSTPPFAESPAKITIGSSELDATPPKTTINGNFTFFHKDGASCTTSGINNTISVENSFGADLAVPAAEKAVGVAGAGATEDGDNCVTTDSGPLGWILCPIIDLASTFSGFVFKAFIIPFLEDVPVTTDPRDGSYIAWQRFRLIGNIVLVGSMLAVVYAQVKGN